MTTTFAGEGRRCSALTIGDVSRELRRLDCLGGARPTLPSSRATSRVEAPLLTPSPGAPHKGGMADRFRMVVRDTFRMGGDRGTVVAGRVEAGSVAPGEAIEMVIAGVATATVVIEIEVQRKSVARATVGEDAALRIKDVDGVFVGSGDVIRAD